MQSYYTIIPSYITTRNDLTGEEKIFYGTVQSLCCKYGFCWASNQTLSRISQKSDRQVRRYVNRLQCLGLLVVEIECHNERKIWTKETWNNRDELIKSYEQDRKFNQRFTRMDMDVQGGRTWMSTNKYNEINIHKELGGKEESMRETKHSLPPISKKINTQEKIAQPVRQKQPVPKIKEKVPIPEPSLEETESLIDRMGRKNYDKYLRNAQNHLKTSKPGSKYHRMSLHDVIWSFYMEDHEKKLAQAAAKKNNMSTRAERRRAWFKEVCEKNPATVGQFSVERTGAQLSCSLGGRVNFVTYDSEAFEEQVEMELKKRKRVFGIDYELPDKEK